jgi:hypothetical protein
MRLTTLSAVAAGAASLVLAGGVGYAAVSTPVAAHSSVTRPASDDPAAHDATDDRVVGHAAAAPHVTPATAPKKAKAKAKPAVRTPARTTVARHSAGSDDPATHDVGDDRGGSSTVSDDPATHDAGDDHGGSGRGGSDDGSGHGGHG